MVNQPYSLFKKSATWNSPKSPLSSKPRIKKLTLSSRSFPFLKGKDSSFLRKFQEQKLASRRTQRDHKLRALQCIAGVNNIRKKWTRKAVRGIVQKKTVAICRRDCLNCENNKNSNTLIVTPHRRKINSFVRWYV